MATMQNALMVNHKFGQITRTTRPIPRTPNAGEITIKIRATALNSADWMIPKWGVIASEYPVVLGFDIAGDVISVGEGVTKFVVGDRVFGTGLPYPDFGGYQDYCKLQTDLAAKIPTQITYDQASTFPIAFFAAYQAMYNILPYGMGLAPLVPSGRDKYLNKPILILGGGSYVGHFAIQLAKLSGFSPIITTSSLKHSKRLTELGAAHIIDRNASPASIREQLIDILPSSPPNLSSSSTELGKNGGVLEYIFDAISAPDTQSIAFDLLLPGGTLGLDLPPNIPTDQNKHVGAAGGHADLPRNRACVKSVYDEFTKWIEDGSFKPSNVEVVPGGIDAVVDSLKRMENDEVSDFKLVIHPSETV